MILLYIHIDGKDHMKSLNMDDEECNRWINSLKFGAKFKNSQCDILKTLNSKYGDIFVHNTLDLARTTNMKHKILRVFHPFGKFIWLFDRFTEDIVFYLTKLSLKIFRNSKTGQRDAKERL